MRTRPHLIIKNHAEKRAAERHIPKGKIWDAGRTITREGVHEHLIIQHKALGPMLTDKQIHLHIGKKQYQADLHKISTRLDIGGTTFVVGIEAGATGYSPVCIVSVWN